MNSATIHILAQVLHHGRIDTWHRGVAELCAACGWGAHNLGGPALFTGSLGTFLFGRDKDGPPPVFPNTLSPSRWPLDPKTKYIDDMTARRRANEDNPTLPDTVSNWFTTTVQNYAGASDTTTAANGCSKG